MKEEFHRIINNNDDLNDAIDRMDNKREEMKRYENRATRRLRDLQKRKKITSFDIAHERNRFEEGYEKHLDKSKEQIDAILNVQGLSRNERDVVKRSAAEMKKAIYKSYDVFVEHFNDMLDELEEKDLDKDNPQPKERQTLFPNDDWRPESSFEPDKKLDTNNGFTSYRRWEKSVGIFFEQGRGRSKPTPCTNQQLD